MTTHKFLQIDFSRRVSTFILETRLKYLSNKYFTFSLKVRYKEVLKKTHELHASKVSQPNDISTKIGKKKAYLNKLYIIALIT